MIDFFLSDYENLISKEWIVTNGLGGYSSSTIIGANTRRYHGILIASLRPPIERRIYVSKVEERIIINETEFQLSTNEYPGIVYPQGFQYIKRFELNPLPTTFFKLGEAELVKTIFMVHGSNTTIVEYKNPSHFAYKLWLNPLYVYRDFHGVSQERHDHHYKTKFMGHVHAIQITDDADNLFFRHSLGHFIESRAWNKNIQFRIDHERGNEHTDDLYSIGYLEHMIEPGESLFLTFTLDKNILDQSPAALKQEEIERLSKKENSTKGEFYNDLVRAGDQFMVTRQSTKASTIIAGYHWFSDWGRDSMIALRGLCIARDKKKEAAEVINTFLAYLNHGLIPNRFPDYEGDNVEYNAIDATLWLFIAVYEFDLRFNDKKFLKNVLPKLKEIIDFQIKGTLHEIKVLDNGLLSGGSRHIQITWMDAKLGDRVFTPRNGCAVEINALWYNALKIYEHVCERLGEKPDQKLQTLRATLKKQFRASFWNEAGYLNDLVNEEGTDSAIRPNQIFAVSLPFSILSKQEEKEVVRTVGDHLLTAYGLRTLEKNHHHFIATYEGGLLSRDSAYHQGTVWPFLLPEYCLAYLKVNDHDAKAKNDVLTMLQPLKEHFYNNEGLHGISEVFDGLSPRQGKGCMHQAWSVSNLILLMAKENLDL